MVTVEDRVVRLESGGTIAITAVVHLACISIEDLAFLGSLAEALRQYKLAAVERSRR